MCLSWHECCIIYPRGLVPRSVKADMTKSLLRVNVPILSGDSRAVTSPSRRVKSRVTQANLCRLLVKDMALDVCQICGSSWTSVNPACRCHLWTCLYFSFVSFSLAGVTHGFFVGEGVLPAVSGVTAVSFG